MDIKSLIMVFFGGGCGACLRFGISHYIIVMGQKPWAGTLISNLLGTFVLFMLSRFSQNLSLSSDMQALVRIGILGSLTTFSTFCFEVVVLMKQGQYYESLSVFLLNILLGILIGVVIFR